MDLVEKIKKTKNLIFSFIEKELTSLKQVFSNYGFEKEEIFKLYLDYLKRGKGIRGGLVLLANQIFSDKKNNEKNLFYLASFFEIIHSSLLIHDDIMDQDKYRRAQETINFHFQNKFKTLSKNHTHLGNSIAINIGDIGFFISFYFLSKIESSKKTKTKLFNLITQEYTKVALAQIDDITFSQTKIEPNLSQIEKIYLYKTARYTFVLPVIATLTLNKNPLAENKIMINLLEKLGIIFQITDDLIGFLSNETGKDLGSDIRENKKTLIRYFMFKELKKNPLRSYFGKVNLSNEEIKTLQNFYQNSVSKKKIESIISHAINSVKADLKVLKTPKGFKVLVEDFIDYLIKRKK